MTRLEPSYGTHSAVTGTNFLVHRKLMPKEGCSETFRISLQEKKRVPFCPCNVQMCTTVHSVRQDCLDFMPETTFTVKLPVLQLIGMARSRLADVLYSTRFSARGIDRAQLDS